MSDFGCCNGGIEENHVLFGRVTVSGFALDEVIVSVKGEWIGGNDLGCLPFAMT